MFSSTRKTKTWLHHYSDVSSNQVLKLPQTGCKSHSGTTLCFNIILPQVEPSWFIISMKWETSFEIALKQFRNSIIFTISKYLKIRLGFRVRNIIGIEEKRSMAFLTYKKFIEAIFKFQKKMYRLNQKIPRMLYWDFKSNRGNLIRVRVFSFLTCEHVKEDLLHVVVFEKWGRKNYLLTNEFNFLISYQWKINSIPINVSIINIITISCDIKISYNNFLMSYFKSQDYNFVTIEQRNILFPKNWFYSAISYNYL